MPVQARGHPPAPPPPAPAPACRRPPAHATIGKDAHCAACWYNLRGLALIGRCPECGTRYNAWNSVRDAERGGRTGRKARRRYLRTITNVPIVSAIEGMRAAGMVVLMVGATGVAVLVVWGVEQFGR